MGSSAISDHQDNRLAGPDQPPAKPTSPDSQWFSTLTNHAHGMGTPPHPQSPKSDPPNPPHLNTDFPPVFSRPSPPLPLPSAQGETSVEELLTQELKQAFGADEIKFSASGREDIDVRMLGAYPGGHPACPALPHPHSPTLGPSPSPPHHTIIPPSPSGTGRPFIVELQDPRVEELSHAVVRKIQQQVGRGRG